MEDALKRLREMHEEQRHRPSPRRYLPNGDLPRGFGDLDVDLIDLDGFVAGYAQRALEGEKLDPAELQPAGHERLGKKIREFSIRYPDMAKPFLEEFLFLDRMLFLIRSLVEQGGRVRNSGKSPPSDLP